MSSLQEGILCCLHCKYIQVELGRCDPKLRRNLEDLTYRGQFSSPYPYQRLAHNTFYGKLHPRHSHISAEP